VKERGTPGSRHVMTRKVAVRPSPLPLPVIPGVVFSGSLDGHLLAYSAEDGKIVWDFDTAREFKTVNGVKAAGGSIDGPGAVVVGGMVFVGSGYARTGGMGATYSWPSLRKSEG
jgi:outer membrane protein assembly factor BamB